MIRSLALLPLLACCHSMPRPASGPTPPMDLHSHAEPARCRVHHVALDLRVDFDQRRLAGHADLVLDRAADADTLVVDTAGIEVHGITADDGTGRSYAFGADDPVLGRPLRIAVRPGDEWVRVHYATAPDAAALQWLAPEQTSGSRPFLFTQGQAILTRSWIPLQDSPGIRVTYDATIRVPRDLGVVAVMSAERRRDLGGGVFRFEMDKPIPPYLIALAAGDLAQRALSERCAVWAEPAVVDRAAAEFEDTEDMVQTCEALFGPYRWGRYDVLVLPPSFPFGGMENPCLTFATPTILAGDKSLVALIAHELAHSWSGNLVTNATWRDFWLNEGFTVFLEQRIMAALYGEERAAMETLHGIRGLERELAELPDRDHRLHLELVGRNPDDGMTAVAYDKGAAFLRRLEEVHGRERFDEFLRRYFARYAFQSITTAEFLAFLDRELLATATAEQRAAVDVEWWVFGPGLPADCPRPTSSALERVDDELARFAGGATAAELDTGGWVTMQWLHFLGGLGDAADAARLADLDAAFGFTRSGNSEIVAAWLELGTRHGYAAVDERLETFLLTVGRRKFLVPLYRALCASESGRERARAIYSRARPRYHAVSVRTLDEIVGG